MNGKVTEWRKRTTSGSCTPQPCLAMRTVGRRERATGVSGDGRLGSYKCSTSTFSSCVGSGKRLGRCTHRQRDRVAFESRLALTACISTISTISAIASSPTRCWRT